MQCRESEASESLRSSLRIHMWAGLAALSVVGLVALLWYGLNKQQQVLIGQTTAGTARNLENLIRQDFEGRTTALASLARRWRSASGTDRSRWLDDANNIFNAHPGFRRIVWIDRSRHIRWIVPTEENRAAVATNIRSLPDSVQMFEVANQTGAPVVSAPIQLIEGDRGMLIMAPVYSGEQFDGVLTGVLHFDSWFGMLFKTALTANFEIAISIGDQTVFGQNHFAAGQKWVQAVETDLHHSPWRIATAPSTKNLGLVNSRFNGIMLGAAIVLGLLMYVATFAGINSRRRAEQLMITSRRLEGLLMNLPGMLCRRGINVPWPIIYCSEGAKTLCGYEPKKFEQQRVQWEALIHPDDLGGVNKTLRQAASDCKPYQVEYRIRTRSGAERWVWERGGMIGQKFDKNSAIKAFVSDITDRKLAESKLIEAQSYSWAIVDVAIEAVIVIGADDKIRSFNREAEDIFGFTVEEVVGHSFRVMLPDKYHSEHCKYIRYFNKTNQLQYVFRRREMQLLRKEGIGFPAHVSVHEIPHQKVQQFVVTVRDISLEQAAEQEARVYREELAHAGRLNMLGEMASGIAHEVNQPLTAISLFAQSGKRLFAAGKQHQLPEVFDKLSLHAQRAGAVIERMQTMARQGLNRQEKVAPSSLMRDVAVLAESEAHFRGFEVEVREEGNLPLLNVDSVQIQQVLLNLLRNGMEAMQSNECQGGDTIVLSARLWGIDTVEIMVADSGGGISDKVAKELFTPFSTTKKSGMGMGLAISQSIVTAHGGHISYENNSIGGATFSFTLPAAKEGEEYE